MILFFQICIWSEGLSGRRLVWILVPHTAHLYLVASYALATQHCPGNIIMFLFFCCFLRKWVPGCGRELIQKGYGMADEIVGVSPRKFLTLYKEVIKLPEFEGSALQNALSERSTVSQKDWGYRSKLL